MASGTNTDHFTGFSVISAALSNPSTNSMISVIPSSVLASYTLPVTAAVSIQDFTGVGRWSHFDLTLNWASPQILDLQYKPSVNNQPNNGDYVQAALFSGTPGSSTLISDFGPGFPVYPSGISEFSFKYTGTITTSNPILRVSYFNAGANDVPGYVVLAAKKVV